MALPSRMRTNERTRLRGSMGRPVRVVNTSPVSAPGRAELRLVVCRLFLANSERVAGKADQREVTVASVVLTGPKRSCP